MEFGPDGDHNGWGKEILLYLQAGPQHAWLVLTGRTWRSWDLANEFEAALLFHHPYLSDHPEDLAAAVEEYYQRMFADNEAIFDHLIQKFESPL